MNNKLFYTVASFWSFCKNPFQCYSLYNIFCGAATQRGSWPPHSWNFLDHTQRRTTVGRTPLDEWSARRRDLYLTTHNTHNRQISMPPGGIRTHDLSRRAAADLRLRPRGHWDRHSLYNTVANINCTICNENQIPEEKLENITEHL